MHGFDIIHAIILSRCHIGKCPYHRVQTKHSFLRPTILGIELHGGWKSKEELSHFIISIARFRDFTGSKCRLRLTKNGNVQECSRHEEADPQYGGSSKTVGRRAVYPG